MGLHSLGVSPGDPVLGISMSGTDRLHTLVYQFIICGSQQKIMASRHFSFQRCCRCTIVTCSRCKCVKEKNECVSCIPLRVKSCRNAPAVSHGETLFQNSTLCTYNYRLPFSPLPGPRQPDSTSGTSPGGGRESEQW